MRIEVELFGELRGLSKNGSKFEHDIEDGATIAQLLSEIGVRDEDSWSAAINGQVAYADTTLTAGSKVIVFPPIQGG